MNPFTNYCFQEAQVMRQLWIWLLTLPVCTAGITIFLYGLYQQLALGKPFGTSPTSDAELIMAAAIVIPILLFVPALLYSIRLLVQVDDTALHLHFRPFRKKKILLSDIASAKPIRCRPIVDYGGWGIRYSLHKRHWAYIVYGSEGVLLQLKTGKQLFIGSQRPNELVAAITNSDPSDP